jgi:hypothetical protein
MADEPGSANAERVERLEHVVRMGSDRPRRLPAGEPMTPQVRRKDAEPALQPLLGEPAEAPPVRIEAVEANDRRRGAIAPFAEVELQLRTGP